MASGEPWQEWVDKAVACPPEWPFGTKLVISDEEWVCLDRGSAVVIKDGIAWVDMLTPDPKYPYGTLVEATLLSP